METPGKEKKKGKNVKNMEEEQTRNPIQYVLIIYHVLSNILGDS